jgi:hypothetical protein
LKVGANKLLKFLDSLPEFQIEKGTMLGGSFVAISAPGVGSMVVLNRPTKEALERALAYHSKHLASMIPKTDALVGPALSRNGSRALDSGSELELGESNFQGGDEES